MSALKTLVVSRGTDSSKSCADLTSTAAGGAHYNPTPGWPRDRLRCNLPPLGSVTRAPPNEPDDGKGATAWGGMCDEAKSGRLRGRVCIVAGARRPDRRRAKIRRCPDHVAFRQPGLDVDAGITCFRSGRDRFDLLAESLEEQLGERRQQPVWRRCRRHGRVAAIEIENELIARVTSHLNPPSSSRGSMIGQTAAQ